MGFGPLVSTRWPADGRTSWPPVSFDRPRRDRSRAGNLEEFDMPEAYIIDAVRTAIGKRNGGLARVHPIDLGGYAFRGLFNRGYVDPAAVDDVIVGCVDAIGGQAGNIGRNAWLAAGYPEEVPGVTVDRQCGSSQQAISFGAQAILSGTADVIVAGGMQNMSQIPI